MSYEHCNIHNCDATNGCPTCMELEAETEAREAVAPLVEKFRTANYPEEPRDMGVFDAEALAMAAYRLGKGS